MLWLLLLIIIIIFVAVISSVITYLIVNLNNCHTQQVIIDKLPPIIDNPKKEEIITCPSDKPFLIDGQCRTSTAYREIEKQLIPSPAPSRSPIGMGITLEQIYR